jgi:molecular chaperone DnaK
MENIAIGIDLGTTYSAMAYINEFGIPTIIPNDSNERITPSVVYFENKDNIVVGKQAKNELYSEPDKVISFVKREMGLKREEVRKSENDGEPKPYDFFGYTYSPEEISSLILKKLKEDAETFFNGQAINDAVITVPAYFNDSEKEATKIAGKMAGFNVLQIINEPTAAAYAYGNSHLANENQTVFVFDLGGGTFDVTVLEITVNGSDKAIRVINTDGDHRLGGKDWDEKIIEFVADKYEREHGFDPREDVGALGGLTESVETAKISLSKKEKAKVMVKPMDYPAMSVEITREEFEEICEDLITRIDLLCSSVLEKSGNRTWSSIDTILLAGGSTRMPMIVDYLQKVSGKEIPTNLVNPDECVALGAAFMAAKLQLDKGVDMGEATENIKNKVGNMSVRDVLSHSLGNIALNSENKEQNFILLERSEPIPSKNTERFYTVQDRQQQVLFRFTEGESTDPDRVKIIQEATLQIRNPMPEGAPLDVTFDFTAEGMLNITAKDVNNNESIFVQVDRKSGLTKEEIERGEKMVRSKNVSGN